MVDDCQVSVELTEGVGQLTWQGGFDHAQLRAALIEAAERAFAEPGVHRLVARIAATDGLARHALHGARFRREGRLRQAWREPDGSWTDALLYARLATDEVSGPIGFSAVMDSVLPTHRVIGHALFRDEAGRVLLLETSYKSDWELPGGVVEPAETPRQGAEREVQEELGIDVVFGEPLVVDWMPPYLGWGDAIEFIFDGGILPAELTAQMRPDLEIKAFHWVSPDELDARVTALSARRIRRLLAGPSRIYTENSHDLG